MKKYRSTLIYSAIALGTGLLSSLITAGHISSSYQALAQAPLKPPKAIFPIVWAVLYLLMGISAAIISRSHSPRKSHALSFWYLQLAVNFLWTILFFNLKFYGFSLFWLILLWFLILAMIISFWKVSPKAALLQIPYLLWTGFAGYLTWWVFMSQPVIFS
ncbi:MAG TPA: tryptophan-rich sensory protein [Candidatus Hungatella pullicola]|mgnify:FL=1|nr:tryptophan-rich sensory protein [Candidatus Hungatella pullicola]